ncbi:Hsp20 family protein [Aestuariispira insulae]|uniref:Molecular chaperone IbpA n=1 Tax=Aestuariispira insulae TaxID=1461337 RepID=A0A3D9HJU5_9PROT|nr:Hsp20 family protein [Aestuariispira insulae]RED49760.1 molecular chaperone IbpA [Aestuariispira insulae]
MRDFDFTPLFRTSVGFDRMARLLDNIQTENTSSYPPYNIEKLDEDSYQISMAVAGFAESELDVEIQDNQLKITGRRDVDEESDANRSFLHRGIAQRAFERRFSLAEHIKVTGAKLENGLLHVKLEREVPEAMKPKSIPIQASSSQKKLAGKS